MLLLTGRPTTQVIIEWERRILTTARWLIAVALVSGIGWLAVGTALFEGRLGALKEPTAIWHSMLDTWPGHVWMLRQGLLIVLAAFLLARTDVSDRWNWFAARAEAFLLAALALIIVGLSGHSAAISESLWPTAADMVHLLGAGIWVGSLVPLALLLQVASRHQRMPDPAAVRTMQRFSHVALVSVVILGGTGSALALLLVQGPAGLVGTAHGRQLLAKLVILVPALLLAAVNRRLLPELSGPVATKSSAVGQRMAFFIALEAALVLLVVGLAAGMTVSTPARHTDPVWPWSVRLSLEALVDSSIAQSAMQSRAVLLLVMFLVLSLFATMLVRRRYIALISVLCAVAAGSAAIGVPLAAVEAFPTTYMRPRVTYHAGSIAEGATLYQLNCASCHGPLVTSREASSDTIIDLRARTTTRRTAGELFWLVTHGKPDKGMPAFSRQLDDAERWHLINFLRAAFVVDRSRRIGPNVEPDQGWLVAPDFTVAVGPLTPGLLRDYRGQRLVLLVLYDMPGSRERMIELARSYRALSVLGVEIIAVPPRTAPAAIATLGVSAPVLFPVVTAGNEDIAAAYRLFTSSAKHAELLIDRQGYIRAIWRGDETGMPDADAVQAQVVRLNEEREPPSLPSDHVH